MLLQACAQEPIILRTSKLSRKATRLAALAGYFFPFTSVLLPLSDPSEPAMLHCEPQVESKEACSLLAASV